MDDNSLVRIGFCLPKVCGKEAMDYLNFALNKQINQEDPENPSFKTNSYIPNGKGYE